jgi:hypothetical protein
MAVMLDVLNGSSGQSAATTDEQGRTALPAGGRSGADLTRIIPFVEGSAG